MITAIGAVIVALIGLVASAISVKKTAGKISWDELLKQDTIDAIRDRGHFVVETGISGKLLQESASSEFARVFANGLDRLDDRVIENIGRRGRFVIEGRILDALLNERTADAPRRLWQWMQDDSKVSQMPIMSLQQQKQFLSNLAQAIRTMPSGPENREVTLAKEETSGA